MNSKYWLALLLSLSLFVISCTSCKQGSAGIDSPQKISIATSKNPWSALTIIAHKKGFFKEQGLEVDLQYVQAAKLAMDALIDLINDIKAARAAGRTDAAVTTAQDFQRRAQFYLDFIESENSNGFHASQEATRILGESINFSRKGQVALRGGVQAVR